MATSLQFAPFSSCVDGGFWHKLTQLKLDVFQLDQTPKALNGFYTNGDAQGLPCLLNVDFKSFEERGSVPPQTFVSHGTICNTNTIEEFKNVDKQAFIQSLGAKLWDDIRSGLAIVDPSVLVKFSLLTFADLKKYHFYFWFAFPALSVLEDVTLESTPKHLTDEYTSEQIAQFLIQYDSFATSVHQAFFVVNILPDGSVRLLSLAQFHEQCDSIDGQVYFGFCDPCTLEHNPGWPLRNYLVLIAHFWSKKLKQSDVRVLCFRDRFRDGRREFSHSIVLHLKPFSADLSGGETSHKCVGWEKNEHSKMIPRFVNLSSSMDPARLASSAVDLNLKLMKWRLLPDLDLDKISSTRCLLLGSGTLGCNVARCLMGWGVRNITLVDNARVSYSNPVRQSLLEFADSLNGGRPKCVAAAEALRRIFPGINATAVEMSIPMPGHFISESTQEQIKRDVEQLRTLIDNHDVVFLLMDTRESRWLPTVMAASQRKLAINAALGFDTFLVLRHGVRRSSGDEMLHSAAAGDAATAASFNTDLDGSELGCYFCNDVVAPGDSTRDRSLDQQCTVSRPGMSMMAAALAVELAVSTITHPLGVFAKADSNMSHDYITKESASPLGLVPHQIRGFLSRFHTILPATKAFDKCTACSQLVTNAYETRGFSFLLDAFNSPSYLEDITGLKALRDEIMDDEIFELDDDEVIT